MSLLPKIQFYLRTLFQRRRLDAQLSEEMRTHVEMATEANRARGMAPDEARHAALKELGNLPAAQERVRDERGWVGLEQFNKDVKFAARSLFRAPGFSLTVVGTLAVGIGVATMVFKLVAPALLLPYAFPHSDELVLIAQRDRTQSDALRVFVYATQFRAFLEQTDVFSTYAVQRQSMVNVVVARDPLLATRAQVSEDFFQTLSIQPAFGRTFLPEDYAAEYGQAVIISDQFWRAHFNGDRDVLGQTLIIDRQACTIVGVLRPGQLWPQPLGGGDVFQPLPPLPADPNNPLGEVLFVMGRLRPGVTAAQALAVLERTALPELAPGIMRFFHNQRPDLLSLSSLRFPDKNTWILVAAGALLYLTAGLNAVNLMLVRLLGRKQELSIRLALGGSRARIIRLLAVESGGLALAACSLVLVANQWMFPSLLYLLTKQDPVGGPLLNWTVFGCITGLGTLACLGIAVLPAIRLARADLQPGLKDGGAGLGESRRMAQLRGILVVLQAALAVVLLSGAGLMIRSFEKIHATDLGINPSRLFKVQLDFSTDLALNFEVRLQTFERLQQRLGALPGVKSVTFGEDTVLTGGFWGREQVVMKDGTLLSTTGSFVADDFYNVAGLTMQRGRWFSPDRKTNEVVLSETMAKALYGESDPLEQTFKLKNYPALVYRVVGVVRDVRESVRSPSGMRFYAPCWWYPPLISTFILRLEREPDPAFASLVRHTLYQFDPTLLAYKVVSYEEAVENSLWSELFAYRVLKALAGIALGLAMIGIFATVAYTVNSRRREFGVRLALGAQPADLLQLVLSRSLLLAAVGVLAGIGAALVLTRYMQSLLFETAPTDPLVHGIVAFLLLAMALLASWLPARRAAKVDPVVALRAE